MYENGNFPRFVGCVRMPGYFGGACANCIWSDHGARCSSYAAADNENPAPPPPPAPSDRRTGLRRDSRRSASPQATTTLSPTGASGGARRRS